MSSGTFELGAVCDSGVDAVWVQRGLQPAAWRELSDILSLITTNPSELPPWMPMPVVGASTPALEPLHVPVVTPVIPPQGDVPPVLDDKPLPPA